MLHLDAEKEKTMPSDTIKIYDTSTGSVKTVVISNPPAHLQRLRLHGIDAFVDPADDKKLTFFLNNHAAYPGEKGKDSKKHGADSTIEVFESRLGDTNWKHVRTIRDDKVYTPNNIVATGPGSFYVTNDNVAKTGLIRQGVLVRMPWSAGNIAYCTFTPGSSGSHTCIEAIGGLLYPNGIARGPSSDSPYPTIYVGHVATGEIKALHADAQGVLHEGETMAELKRAIDNIQVDESGSIYAATLPKIPDFVKRATEGGGAAATEIWKVSNNTNEGSFYGEKYTTERVFADPGTITPGTTNAQMYKGKLYLTGVTTEALHVCELN